MVPIYILRKCIAVLSNLFRIKNKYFLHLGEAMHEVKSSNRARITCRRNLNATQVCGEFFIHSKNCPNQKLEIIISEYVEIDL